MKFRKFMPDIIDELSLKKAAGQEARQIPGITILAAANYVINCSETKTHSNDTYDDICAAYCETVPIFHAIVWHLGLFKKTGRKIYHYNEEFFKLFKDINSDLLSANFLKNEMCAFVSFPIEQKVVFNNKINTVSGFYFTVSLKGDVCALTIFTVASRHTEVINLNFNNKRKDLISEIIKEEIKDESKFNYAKLCLNLIAYLYTGNPDLRSFRNKLEYRGNSSTKAINRDKDYSKSEITLVGFNFLKGKLYGSESWVSKPHLSFRWCGPNKSELRLVFVNGSVKKWKSSGRDKTVSDQISQTI